MRTIENQTGNGLPTRIDIDPNSLPNIVVIKAPDRHIDRLFRVAQRRDAAATQAIFQQGASL